MNMDNDTIACFITDIELRPVRFRRHDLSEIASIVLGAYHDNWEYWAEELDNGRVRIEVNPYDGEEWDAALSVFRVGHFIGDVLLRGDIDVEAIRHDDERGGSRTSFFVVGDFIDHTEAWT